MPTAGLDEAGRGPVIGPMAIAGVLLSPKAARELRRLGVRDSKRVSPAKREELADLIREVADDYVVKLVEPKRIDEVVSVNGLNVLEAEVMASIIRELRPGLAIIDLPGRSSRRFKETLRRWLGDLKVRIRAENRADSKFVHVAAASILAKVERDKRIAELRAKAGFDFGSGYPSDPRTKEFLRMVLKGMDFPRDQIRWRWATVRKAIDELRQTRLDDYFD